MAQASASRLALTVKLEMYIDEFFNSPFFTNYSSSYLLMTLKDITSLLPNLPVKRLNVDRSGSRRRNFVDDFSADGKTGESLLCLQASDVFICTRARHQKKGIFLEYKLHIRNATFYHDYLVYLHVM